MLEKTDNPLVSIVIPSFNKADLLIEMIKSIVHQTYKNWELIVVDDGSDENNFQKVLNFTKTDGRCHYLRRSRDPKNGDTCRNIGMDMAEGKYLIIFDSDDIITPSCIQNRVGYMQAHPECDYVTFPHIVFNNGEKILTGSIKKQLNIVPEENIITSLLKSKYPFTVWANIYKMEAVKNISWDENVYIYQDFDFMLQCALADLRHDYCDGEPDYYYRQFKDGSNVCGDFISKQKCESTLYLFNKTLSILRRREDYEYRKQEFLDFIVLHFKRLILGRKFDDSRSFIEMLKKYYSNSEIVKFERILKEFCKGGNGKLYEAKVYWKFYRIWHGPFDKTMAIHTIGKIVLGRI